MQKIDKKDDFVASLSNLQKLGKSVYKFFKRMQKVQKLKLDGSSITLLPTLQGKSSSMIYTLSS